MRFKTVFALLLALVAGGIVYYLRSTPAKAKLDDPLIVMVNQVRTRAVIQHQRSITVWYRACPEVPGVNPEVLVIWPGYLRYELGLTATKIQLVGDVLTVTAAGDQALVLAEMRKSSPLARHLGGYYLRRDPSLTQQFRVELEEFLRGIAGALNVPISRIDISIPESTAPIPTRPDLQLCAGASAFANGVPFARAQDDGTTISVYPEVN
ncbi:MAG: hypothetical protein IPG25_00370 [Proteobacteria bacterium]|nr:hypothetical protein [Pseudomonadota bacterium]